MKKIVTILVLAFACSDRPIEGNSEVKQSQEHLTMPSSSPDDRAGVGNKNGSLLPSAILITRDVLNNVEVLVPQSFNLMDAEMMAIKYPLKELMTFQVFTNEDATVNVAFEHLPNRATQKDLPAIMRVFEQQFNQPGIDFRKSEVKSINGRDFVVIEMITPAIDTEVYNLMFVTSLEDRLLMSTFNCTIDKLKEWQPIAEQIVSSVRVTD